MNILNTNGTYVCARNYYELTHTHKGEQPALPALWQRGSQCWLLVTNPCF